MRNATRLNRFIVRTKGHVVEIEDTDVVRDFVNRSQVQPAPELKPELGPIPLSLSKWKTKIQPTKVNNF
jgi:hypothetical protein